MIASKGSSEDVLISALVFLAACLGISAIQLSSIRERHHEIHLLRAMGASSSFLFLLIEFEVLIITLMSIGIGIAIMMLTQVIFQEQLITTIGVNMQTSQLHAHHIKLIGILMFTSVAIAAIPSISAYRQANKI